MMKLSLCCFAVVQSLPPSSEQELFFSSELMSVCDRRHGGMDLPVEFHHPHQQRNIETVGR